MNSKDKNAYLQLHIAVFIFGFTAILGALISADHFTLVWHRMWLAALGFFLVPGFVKALRSTDKMQLLKLAGIGVMVAIHWLTFYGSIKIGKSASLTLGCFGLTSTFTSVLEPIIYRKRFVLMDVLLGLLALVGICIIAFYTPEETEGSGNYALAIAVGVFSTFMAALFSTINSTFARKVDTKVMSFAELSGGFIFLCILLLFQVHVDEVLPVNSFNILPHTLEPKLIECGFCYEPERHEARICLYGQLGHQFRTSLWNYIGGSYFKGTRILNPSILLRCGNHITQCHYPFNNQIACKIKLTKSLRKGAAYIRKNLRVKKWINWFWKPCCGMPILPPTTKAITHGGLW